VNLLTFFTCLLRGHRWRASHSRPGYMTCVSCRMRKLAA
jgi:hypothetical protein